MQADFFFSYNFETGYANGRVRNNMIKSTPTGEISERTIILMRVVSLMQFDDAFRSIFRDAVAGKTNKRTGKLFISISMHAS